MATVRIYIEKDFLFSKNHSYNVVGVRDDGLDYVLSSADSLTAAVAKARILAKERNISADVNKVYSYGSGGR
jgi:hypothetical protein